MVVQLAGDFCREFKRPASQPVCRKRLDGLPPPLPADALDEERTSVGVESVGRLAGMLDECPGNDFAVGTACKCGVEQQAAVAVTGIAAAVATRRQQACRYAQNNRRQCGPQALHPFLRSL